MKMLPISSILLGLTLLVSCQEVNLNLDINDNLTLKKNPIIKRNITFPPGQYTGTLRLKRKKVVLKVDGFKGSVYFKIPGGVSKLPENGTRVLNSSQTGQPVTTTVEINTEITYGDQVNTRETCSETRAIPCYGNGYNYPYYGRFNRYGYPYYYNSGASCYNGIALVTFYGSREVEYRPKTKRTFINLGLAKDNVEKLTADGVLTDRSKDYSYYGECDT